jgi:hypothetical protein
MPARLALNNRPSLSGLMAQFSDRTGAMKDMMSMSVPSSMLSRKHRATTNTRLGVQVAASAAIASMVVSHARAARCQYRPQA